MFPGAWWSWTMAALFTTLVALSLYARRILGLWPFRVSMSGHRQPS
ncbi:hypothetical protein [Micromonospora sp. NPDC005203]